MVSCCLIVMDLVNISIFLMKGLRHEGSHLCYVMRGTYCLGFTNMAVKIQLFCSNSFLNFVKVTFS